MCKTGTFLWGLAAGMVAGAMLEIIILPRPRPRRTAIRDKWIPEPVHCLGLDI